MWTSISNLDFDDEMLFYTANSSSNDERRQMSFLKFVYRVLLLLEVSNVNTFRIKCSRISNVSYVNSWVTAVLFPLKRLIVKYPASCWETSIHEIGIINTEAACPYEIQLNTPNLLYFAYMGWVAEGFAMNNLSSLVEASVDIDIWDLWTTTSISTTFGSGTCLSVTLEKINMGMFRGQENDRGEGGRVFSDQRESSEDYEYTV
ncbi:hypothetical protein RHGRI_003751 [Rhododendron griersonianum]|uniref:F-box associated domain-containing protein n=1 Tax=Rhododendron griersonianum TaxID=479676 RepID=A0AAV6L656_9ERIC|nr:hypothetical protein RHGRI_003751 [Rhododendron griersonianum]